MRKLLAFPLLVCVLFAVGCNNPTGTQRRSLIGLWTSSQFGNGTVQMTLTEVAREVRGAGNWVRPDQAIAFGISGAHADETVSLLFEFKYEFDINFVGRFTDENTLQGSLTGGTFRGVPVTFVRVEEQS